MQLLACLSWRAEKHFLKKRLQQLPQEAASHELIGDKCPKQGLSVSLVFVGRCNFLRLRPYQMYCC